MRSQVKADLAGKKAIILLGGGLLQAGKTPRLTFLLARAKVQIDFLHLINKESGAGLATARQEYVSR